MVKGQYWERRSFFIYSFTIVNGINLANKGGRNRMNYKSELKWRFIALVIIIGIMTILHSDYSVTNILSDQTKEKPIISIQEEEINKKVLAALVTAIKEGGFNYNKATANNIDVKQDGDTIEVRINIESMILFFPELTSKMDYYHNIALSTFIDCGRQIFAEYKDINYLRIVFWEKGHDSYGKEKPIENFIVAMDRSTFEKVNWEVVGDDLVIMLKNYDPSIFEEFYERGVSQ